MFTEITRSCAVGLLRLEWGRSAANAHDAGCCGKTEEAGKREGGSEGRPVLPLSKRSGSCLSVRGQGAGPMLAQRQPLTQHHASCCQQRLSGQQLLLHQHAVHSRILLLQPLKFSSCCTASRGQRSRSCRRRCRGRCCLRCCRRRCCRRTRGPCCSLSCRCRCRCGCSCSCCVAHAHGTAVSGIILIGASSSSCCCCCCSQKKGRLRRDGRTARAASAAGCSCSGLGSQGCSSCCCGSRGSGGNASGDRGARVTGVTGPTGAAATNPLLGDASAGGADQRLSCCAHLLMGKLPRQEQGGGW